MGRKCTKCKSTNTSSPEPGEMWCKSCGHSWRPYKHRGKKMKMVGDGILTERKRIMPGAKTERIGDDIITKKKRVKKKKKKDFLGMHFF